jgi:type I restriction enzyme, S subunit
MTTTKNNEHKKLNVPNKQEQNQTCLDSAEREGLSPKGNVPNLRFPEFQGEWSVTTLQKDCIVNPTNEKIADKFVYVDLESVKQGQLYKYQILTKDNAPSRAQRVLHTDDILFQCVRPYQMNNYMVKGTMSDIQWVASTGYAQIRTQTDYPAFLYYVLNTSKYNKAVMVRCTGSSYPAINSEDLSKIPFYKCGIAEQKKIADFLFLLDERIATQNKIIDKLQSLIKGIAQHCIRELINGWEYVRLGDICKITTGKLDANAQVENGQYPFFTCAERPFNIDSYAFDTEALLISGNGANLGYINYYKGKFNAYQRTYVLDQFSVNIQYVKWALKVLLPQRIAIEKSSSNTPYIVLSTLADLKIPIPNNSKQNHIADLMMLFERKLSTQLALSDLYNKQKQYLLRQMFI